MDKPWFIREVQIKTTITYHPTSVRIVVIKKTRDDEGMEKG